MKAPVPKVIRALEPLPPPASSPPRGTLPYTPTPVPMSASSSEYKGKKGGAGKGNSKGDGTDNSKGGGKDTGKGDGSHSKGGKSV